MLKLKEFFGFTIYISELDQFLNHFDKMHLKLSASQRHEKEKYELIYKLRDNEHLHPVSEKFWNNF